MGYEIDKNGYQGNFELHPHYDAKMPEYIPNYGVCQPESNNWMNNWMGYFEIPFLPGGQPRFNPKFLQSNSKETT